MEKCLYKYLERFFPAHVSPVQETVLHPHNKPRHMMGQLMNAQQSWMNRRPPGEESNIHYWLMTIGNNI